jgi:hypothetical protein
MDVTGILCFELKVSVAQPGARRTLMRARTRINQFLRIAGLPSNQVYLILPQTDYPVNGKLGGLRAE